MLQTIAGGNDFTTNRWTLEIGVLEAAKALTLEAMQ